MLIKKTEEHIITQVKFINIVHRSAFVLIDKKMQ